MKTTTLSSELNAAAMAATASHYGTVLVLCGRSGSGKTTIAERLLATGRFGKVVTTTTRAPRTGEENGVQYHFTDVAGFERQLHAGELVEYAQVCGRWYGTSAAALSEVLASGRHAVLVMDPQGAIAMSNWAKTTGYRFAVAFIAADDALLATHIAARYLDALESGTPPAEALSTNAERLLSLFTVEQNWINAMGYQRVLFNDHKKGSLDYLVRSIVIAADAARVPTTVLTPPPSLTAAPNVSPDLAPAVREFLLSTVDSSSPQILASARSLLGRWIPDLDEGLAL